MMLVRQDARPVIVTGDFKDASWSSTMHQLTQCGELHDVSEGRCLYNTFNAHSALAR